LYSGSTWFESWPELSQYRDWAMGWMTVVQFPVGAMMEYFQFVTLSRQVLGPTQPLIQWVPGALSLKAAADHSPPSNAEVKE